MPHKDEHHLTGKKLMFDTPEELQAAVDSYFEACDNETIAVLHKQLDKSGQPVRLDIKRPYTVEGLAMHLNTSRMVILNYEGREEYAEIISKAKQRITQHKVERGLIGAYEPRFAMFDLINNSGYKNEKAVDHTSGGQPITRIIVE